MRQKYTGHNASSREMGARNTERGQDWVHLRCFSADPRDLVSRVKKVEWYRGTVRNVDLRRNEPGG